MANPGISMTYKQRNQKTAIEIIGIGDNTERVVEMILKDGGKARVRRDLVEIWGNRAFVPKWLADKITKNKS